MLNSTDALPDAAVLLGSKGGRCTPCSMAPKERHPRQADALAAVAGGEHLLIVLLVPWRLLQCRSVKVLLHPLQQSTWQQAACSLMTS